MTKWDTTHNVTIESLADGVEETAVIGLISPPAGAQLLSAVGDIGGNGCYTSCAWVVTDTLIFLQVLSTTTWIHPQRQHIQTHPGRLLRASILRGIIHPTLFVLGLDLALLPCSARYPRMAVFHGKKNTTWF